METLRDPLINTLGADHKQMLTDAEEDTLNTSRQTLCLERNEES